MNEEEAKGWVERVPQSWHFQIPHDEYVAMFKATAPLRYGP